MKNTMIDLFFSSLLSNIENSLDKVKRFIIDYQKSKLQDILNLNYEQNFKYRKNTSSFTITEKKNNNFQIEALECDANSIENHDMGQNNSNMGSIHTERGETHTDTHRARGETQTDRGETHRARGETLTEGMETHTATDTTKVNRSFQKISNKTTGQLEYEQIQVSKDIIHKFSDLTFNNSINALVNDKFPQNKQFDVDKYKSKKNISSDVNQNETSFDKRKINEQMRSLIKSESIDEKVKISSKQDNEQMVKSSRSNIYFYEHIDDHIDDFYDINLSIKKSRSKRKYALSQFNYEKDLIIDSQNNLVIVPLINKQENIEIFKKDEEFYIDEKSSFSYCWSICMTIILAFQILVFPLENQSEMWLIKNPTYLLIQLLFEWFFIADVIINFFTSYKDQQGHLIKKLDGIIKNQLRTWFVLDLISSIPTNSLDRYGILSMNASQNVYLRLLKMPKQIRVLKGILNIFESRLSSNIQTEWMINLNKIELIRFTNVVKQLLFFLQMINFLSCQMISLVKECDEHINCLNWFYPLMIKEFGFVLNDPDHKLYHLATHLVETLPQEEASKEFQNYIIHNNRMYLQLDAWQFLMQTVTTVGFGDIIAQTTAERFLRTICMIIGTILFSLLVSNFLEQCITETLNIQRQNEHEYMIEKLQSKYNIIGDPKRYLNLLGDSVQTERLDKELEFANMLPEIMSDSVIKQIWKVYQNKMTLLQEESLSIFIMMMKISIFRRCVQEETITGGESIRIVYSGNIGCQVSNLKHLINQEYLQYLGVGSEIGYYDQLNLGEKQDITLLKCTVNTELVEIKCNDFIKLITFSLKGLDQVYDQLLDVILDTQMMVAMCYSMLKVGFYIENKWQNSIISFLKFSDADFIILDKLYMNFTESNLRYTLNYNLTQKFDALGKWYTHILDNDTYKQLNNRAKELLPILVHNEQNLLVQFVKNFKKNYKLGKRSTIFDNCKL